MSLATIVYNPKYGKYDGVLNGKVVSRCATVQAVTKYFSDRGVVAAYLPVVALPGHDKRVDTDPDADLKRWLKEESEIVWALAKRLFPNLDRGMPDVFFFSNGTTAGKASRTMHWVSYNTTLARTNRSEFKNTVIHEIAHVVATNLYGAYIRPHGREWSYVMTILGGNAKRTHSYDCSEVKGAHQRYTVYCSCGEHEVTKRSLNRLWAYKCKRCGSGLSTTKKVVA